MKPSIISQISRFENKQHNCDGFPFIVYQGIIPALFQEYPLHWHDEMEIIYIEKGTCRITMDKSRHPASAGDILFVTPGMLHAIEQADGAECIYYNIVFDLHLLGSPDASDSCFLRYIQPCIDGQFLLPHILSDDSLVHARLLKCLSALAASREDRSEGRELIIKSCLFEIFWLLWQLRIRNTEAGADRRHTSQTEKMKELIRFINTNYSRQITIQEAADFCGYSPSYFMKFFKSFTGSTFVAYLNNYRLQKAGELLGSSQNTVLEISEMTGFENHSYFIRLFRRQFGITPFQYRRQISAKSAKKLPH